jgi:hypothetical protein
MVDGSQRHVGPGKPPRRKRGKPDMLRRLEAVERTKAKFGGKAFALGSNDCGKLLAFHLKAMGHKLPSSGSYTTEAGAIRACRRAGGDTLTEVLDKHLERIPPAAMLLGDVAILKSEDEEETASRLGAAVVHLGGKMMGWHPDQAELAVMDILAVEAAWRC